MKTTTMRLTTLLLAVFFLIYAVIQIFRYYNTPLKTQTAVNYTVADMVVAKGIVIRDEERVSAPANGMVSYLHGDGVKVSSGTAIAEVYSSPDDAHAQQRVREIDEEISALINAKEQGASYFSHTDVISRQISQNVGRYIDALERGDVYSCLAIKRDVAAGMNKKQIATHTEKDFSLRISELEAEKSSLKASISSLVATVRAAHSGYFVKDTDGLEELLTPATLTDITVDSLRQLIDQGGSALSGQSGGVGKLVHDFRWQFAAVLPVETLQRLRQGSTVEVDFGLQSVGPVKATVERIEPGGLHSDGFLILNCNQISEELLGLRVREATIKLSSINGLMISSKALRFVDGQKGVFVRRGYTVLYRPVETLYEDASYIICNPQFNDGGTVRLFDEVVVEGTDLYDGKLIE